MSLNLEEDTHLETSPPPAGNGLIVLTVACGRAERDGDDAAH